MSATTLIVIIVVAVIVILLIALFFAPQTVAEKGGAAGADEGGVRLRVLAHRRSRRALTGQGRDRRPDLLDYAARYIAVWAGQDGRWRMVSVQFYPIARTG